MYGAEIFVALALLLQLLSTLMVLGRLGRKGPVSAPDKAPAISVLRPLCGLENNLEETLGTTFVLDYPEYEIVFCVEAPDDPAIELAQGLIDAHPAVPARILIGPDPVSGNPKLNNLVKGWAAARHNWIVMSDSNVLLPTDYLSVLYACWDKETGLVSAPPSGIRPVGFWAKLECAFLNTYQARWQLAADQVGIGFAQGKTLFWRRDLLEAAGGIAQLGTEMAEDVASTKITRRAGLKVRVAPRPFAQPVGKRRFSDVWGRQLRWSRVRRLGFRGYFLPEIMSGGLFPILIAALLVLLGQMPWVLLPVLFVLWYGAEFGLAWVAGWPRTVGDILSWVVRDALIAPLWGAAWASGDFEWRGNAMRATDVPLHPGSKG